MGQLKSGRRTVGSIFHLRGFKETHMTDSLAFVLSRVPALHNAILKCSGSQVVVCDADEMFVQRSSLGKGRTDIELLGADYHVICEAKRGLRLPSSRQLRRYENSLIKEGKPTQELLVLTDSDPGYARSQLNGYCMKVPLRFLSWRQVHDAAVSLAAASEGAARLWLDELLGYLREHLRRVERLGMVRIVTLNRSPRPGRAHSSVELLKQHRYIHPIRRGYPSHPAPMLGFRYDGHLQHVFPVLATTLVETLPAEFATPDAGDTGRHFIYALGEELPLADKHQPGALWKIKSGPIRDRVLWLPLASIEKHKTLAEASTAHTAERRQRQEKKQRKKP